MKLGNLILQPPGKATGCLLVTRLESAPDVTWGPGVPKRTALCARTLPPTYPTSCVFKLGLCKKPEAGGEAVEIGQKVPAGEKKRKEKSLVESVMPHCSAAHSLSVHICAQSGSKRIQLSTFFITAHILPSHSPKPVVFSTSIGTDTLSPLQLHPLPNRCSVAKLQSTYVIFKN